jgi:hypothetical protein
MEIPVSIKLETLSYQQGGSKAFARPYLWTYFFKADGSSFMVNNAFNIQGNIISFCPEGSHGNLLEQRVTPGASIPIPVERGVWNAGLSNMIIPYFNQALIPGVIGVVAVLLHQEGVSTRGMEAGRAAMHSFLDDSLNAMIVGLKPAHIDLKNIEGSVKKYFEEASKERLEGLTPAIVQAIRKEQNLVQNMLSLLNKDELIGFHFWQFTADQIKEGREVLINKDWSHNRLGDWHLKGRVVFNEKSY